MQEYKETILLAEDEELLRTVVQATLKSNGYRVLTACDGVEALEVFRREQETVSLVLMDFGLPGLSGLAALREMKKLNSETRAIICSGFLEPTIREAVLELSHTGTLTKPYKEEEILDLVRRVLCQSESVEMQTP
jgi:two-component system, cell cycle sensor histidine kinase and response regulator CckA